MILYVPIKIFKNWSYQWKQHFSCWSPCFGFFVCPFYNRETHYPMLEKPGAQNITVCENQGKQCKLCDHWNLKKNVFKKITGDTAKKTVRLTEI